MNKGIARCESKQDRSIGEDGQKLARPQLHCDLVTAAVTVIAGIGASPHNAVAPGAECKQKVRTAHHRIRSDQPGTGYDADQMSLNPKLCTESLEQICIRNHIAASYHAVSSYGDV